MASTARQAQITVKHDDGTTEFIGTVNEWSVGVDAIRATIVPTSGIFRSGPFTTGRGTPIDYLDAIDAVTAPAVYIPPPEPLAEPVAIQQPDWLFFAGMAVIVTMCVYPDWNRFAWQVAVMAEPLAWLGSLIAADPGKAYVIGSYIAVPLAIVVLLVVTRYRDLTGRKSWEWVGGFISEAALGAVVLAPLVVFFAAIAALFVGGDMLIRYAATGRFTSKDDQCSQPTTSAF